MLYIFTLVFTLALASKVGKSDLHDDHKRYFSDPNHLPSSRSIKEAFMTPISIIASIIPNHSPC